MVADRKRGAPTQAVKALTAMWPRSFKRHRGWGQIFLIRWNVVGAIETNSNVFSTGEVPGTPLP